MKVADRERKCVCVCICVCVRACACTKRVCACTKRVSRRHSRTLRIKGRDVNTVCSEFKRVSKGPRSVTLSRVDEKGGGGGLLCALSPLKAMLSLLSLSLYGFLFKTI